MRHAKKITIIIIRQGVKCAQQKGVNIYFATRPLNFLYQLDMLSLDCYNSKVLVTRTLMTGDRLMIAVSPTCGGAVIRIQVI